SLKDGTLRFREVVLLDPKEKCPVLELMPTRPVKTGIFHFTPDRAVLAMAMSNEGEKGRWAKALQLLDGFAKLTGSRPGRPAPVPSEEIAKVEKALGIDFGKDVFDKITAAGFALGDPFDMKMRRVELGPGRSRTEPEVPVVFVVQAASAADARRLA